MEISESSIVLLRGKLALILNYDNGFIKIILFIKLTFETLSKDEQNV